MKEGYIGIPSLTEAQRASELLRRERIANTVIRMPSLPGKSGCAFGLRVQAAELNAARTLLSRHGFRVGRVLVRENDGTLRELKA